MSVLVTRTDAVPATPIATHRASRRWTVFVHQDGLLVSTTLRAIAELGLLERSLEAEQSVAQLYPGITPSGFAYLRVGLRCLASQGWLAAEPTLGPETTVLRWTEAGQQASRYWDSYIAVGRFLSKFTGASPDAWASRWNAEQTKLFCDLLPLASSRWHVAEDLPCQLGALVRTHLDAGLAVPAMLWLRSSGALGHKGPLLPDSVAGAAVARLFVALGWIDGQTQSWTVEGAEVAELSVHFGMAASYLPLLARLPDLYRGDLVVGPGPAGGEWHVHRALNVIASGAAHSRYYEDADNIFLELFNRLPVEAQPRFIADMGCGDGSWLAHLYRLIRERTLRGEQLAEHPLIMVGLDYNPAALDAAEKLLAAAGIPALLLQGDISDPDAVSGSLAQYGLAMADGLHIRAFIDHNRAYGGAPPGFSVRGCSSGAYVDGQGGALDPIAVEADFVAHLRRWAPHVRKHGIVMLEAHCVAADIARKHLGATHAVAFDAYHGYSHQYPIEHSAFLRCCREAGLRPVSHCERRYPSKRPFVAVSLNRLLVPEQDAAVFGKPTCSPRAGSWRPERPADLTDGRALHQLLYNDGDLRYPRLWCSAATGFVVSGVLEVVEERLAQARRGDVIRVLDYGAGTGLATIEFLKGCHERKLAAQLADRGVKLEVHLVDLPSSWFAQGFELLQSCAWAEFHSLRGSDGKFRALLDVIGGRRIDAMMANMVFHLIPPRGLIRAAAELASIVKPGGRLLWSSPDLGPPGPYAVLFHDANRRLRHRWLELLSSQEPVSTNVRGGLYSPALCDVVREARASVNAGALREAELRASRRVLPSANRALDVADALQGQFAGESRLAFETYELLEEDVLDTILVPANQTEYLPEVSDPGQRELVIRELMSSDVLPLMRATAGATAIGLNVQWTLGAATKQSHVGHSS